MTDDLHDAWHRATCNELERRVKNRDFWIWVRVEEEAELVAGPDEADPAAWRTVAEEVERWLEELDPQAIDADDPPARTIQLGDTLVELAATAKKPRRRGTDPLIGNLYPGMTYPRGSYRAGPAPELPDTPPAEPNGD